MSEYETAPIDNKIDQILLNKDGSTKKIQKLKTENRTDYMRDYMKGYIKTCPTIVCELCNGKYKKYQEYIHNKGKFHTLLKNRNDLKIDLLTHSN